MHLTWPWKPTAWNWCAKCQTVALEHEFSFRNVPTGKTTKRDFLFRTSVFPGNFPLGRAELFHLHRNRNFRKFFESGKNLEFLLHCISYITACYSWDAMPELGTSRSLERFRIYCRFVFMFSWKNKFIVENSAKWFCPVNLTQNYSILMRNWKR